MRNRIISCVICGLMITTILVIELPKDVNAQVTEEWVARYDVANNADWANAITVGPSGNTYVTGHSYIGFESDYATVAYDPNGNELWVARYDGPAGPFSQSSGDYPYDIVVDSSENIYVTGTSRSTGSPIDYGEGYDIATIAYDISGNTLWLTKYNGLGNGYDRALAMVIKSNGNIYVTGHSHGIGTDGDYVTIAYDSLGNQQWVARYNGPGNGFDEAYDIALDEVSGNIAITGRSWGVNGYYNYCTVSYDSNGNELWVARYDIRLGEAETVEVDTGGNIYVTGGSDGDFLTVAYNSTGIQLWDARIENGHGRDIILNDTGRIYVTGSFRNNSLNSNYLTVAYDINGNQLWATTYDGPGNGYDEARVIGDDPQGNVIISGGSHGGATHYDFTTIAYDSNGNELWVERYNGPTNRGEHTRAMAIGLNGNIYVTGGSGGVSTGSDFTTIKYSQEIDEQPPISNAGLDQSINEGEIVQHDGSSSYDPDGIIQNFKWDFDANVDSNRDGDFTNDVDATGPTPTHIYYVPGIYTVTLTVTDNDGLSDTDICIVTILPKVLSATIDIDPNTLNLKSKGRWITCYINLNDPYDVNDIDISTILLEDTIPAEWGDIQGDTLMVKFDRSEVEDMLSPGTYNLKVTGELTDGAYFEGYSDEIRIIDPGK